MDVAVGSVLLLAEALAVVDAASPGSVYWAGRACLVRRPEDVAGYDRAFAAFWLGQPASSDGGDNTAPPIDVAVALDDEDGDGPAGDDAGAVDDRDVVAVRYSAIEVLRHKDFAACSDDERALLARLSNRVRVAGPSRRTRRMVPSRRRRGQPDVRATFRHALRTAGEPVHRRHRQPGERHRPVVLLCDVSGSMEPYARALLHFLHGAVASRARVEAFTLGTRLTRVTRPLRSHDADEALRRASQAVADWSGGTRLGDGLRAFNDEWGVRGMARGAVVVVLSDGWDRGDPELLGAELARLRRVAHRVVWVNPLKAGPGYAPLARGMAAALPHLDAFVEGHNLASLESLAEVIAS